jgi:hypothetical protein
MYGYRFHASRLQMWGNYSDLGAKRPDTGEDDHIYKTIPLSMYSLYQSRNKMVSNPIRQAAADKFRKRLARISHGALRNAG